ncbi:ribonuclease E/G [Paralimibaculum aggregatum]|uniref:Ribonuclease E/G n=1 Tax=Paralimibaculum aggregatum TaxID=3036245 RepID=A0ABQ6LJE6_9RHOB|nr:ribonuclease E/G [Limibaculum sp. NKW23]GMG83386.1 ribonuclease E/G [Limibaculum sp. NKW23]
MTRHLLIDRVSGRPAAALLVDGRLEDLLVDPPAGDAMPRPGEILAAKIDRLVPKLGAAFVALGGGRTGFLREARGRRAGERLAVQVVSHPEAGKASPVTARILHKGRRLIHTPGAPGINLSRQIRDADERARLTAVVEGWEPGPEIAPEALRAALRGMARGDGTILRTAAIGAAEAELAAELGQLLLERAALEGLDGAAVPPAGSPSVREALRDWTDPVPRILVGRETWHELAGELERAGAVSADLRAAMQRFDGPDLFDHHGLWEAIEALRSPRAALPSGGWMQIEPTAALVAVDVNTGGGFQGGDALTANLEAVRELPRQLRLRGLGGIVALDLAPLPKRDRKRLEDALRTALRRDPVETSLAGWTPLGLVELQRKRERRPILELI